MAQRISQLPNEAIPYAQEALGMSSLKRGLGMMNNPNAGMKNQMDGGAFSNCLLYTSPSPRDATLSRMPSSA